MLHVYNLAHAGKESLVLAGEIYKMNKSMQCACDFLLSKWHGDGGWGPGESHKVGNDISCS